MAEETVSSERLMAAFRRLRSHWKALFDSRPEGILSDVTEDLPVVGMAARISLNTVPYVETIFRIRLGDLDFDMDSIPHDLGETVAPLRTGFETLVRALQQMEAGEDILPESGMDMRRNAARTVSFFLTLRELDGPKHQLPPDSQGQESPRPRESREEKIQRLIQSYDGRRKLVREDVEVQPEAVEAVEFLLRLGVT